MTTALARPRLLAAAVALALAACEDGGTAGEGRELLPARQIEMGMIAAVAGRGATLVVQAREQVNGYWAVLQVYRQDPAHPGELLVEGSLDLGIASGTANDLTVSEDRAALVFRDPSKVVVVALDAGAPTLVASLDRPQPTHAAAAGRWLALTADGSNPSLYLIDLEADPPITHALFTAGAPVTTILPCFGGFTVFTTHGRGRLQADERGLWSYTYATDDAVRGYAKVELHGTLGWAAGPSPFAGRTRIAKLDLTDRLAPAVAWSADLDGNYEDFTCDGAGRCFVATDVAEVRSSLVGTILIEESGAVRSDPPYSVTGLTRAEASFVHANAGWLYTGYAWWTEEYHSGTPDRLAIIELP